MIKRWYARWLVRRERKSLERRQRAALASEIGLPEDFIARLMTHGERNNDELYQMLAVLGLDVQDVKERYAAQLRHMGTSCSECLAIRRCHREFEAGTARMNYHAFCPNAAALDELQGDIWCDRKERQRNRINPVPRHSSL